MILSAATYDGYKTCQAGGDTAFPAIYPEKGEEFVFMNYTTPLSKRDRWWSHEQLGSTVLYVARLRWERK
ncbi:MAG: hypothetical protein RMJ66_05220 [Bacteroidia bacterium]|nr:hypothetical protein [Bacteroidia bacterium]MDW8134448.1 hypothetical protein [Bacteroidia bacterium]